MALEALAKRLAAERAQIQKKVKVCMGTSCMSGGAEEIFRTFQAEVERQGLEAKVVPVGCQGFCQGAPIVSMEPYQFFFNKVSVFDVPKIVDIALRRGVELPQHFYRDPETGKVCRRKEDMSFYRYQTRIAIMKDLGEINPMDIEDYIAVGGYLALAKALTEMNPEEVIEEVKKSGLRGRGGAGFPTGRKWEGARRAPGEKKYVICNGDEGDPGAFMDCSIMEGNPHSVLEGMLICAYAIGSDEGYIYVRAEYPLAVKRLELAIEQARERGLLGERILGTNFNFDLRVKKGAGAYVCGESTTLMISIEGKRPEPRVTPPRSVEQGLWGMPTCLNNVETFANIPAIILNGGDWYAQYGTEGSKGTKTFCITGKTRNTGLIEVPMGMTLKEVVFKVGGGVMGEGRFKAVQTGGPSGGCIPEAYLDASVDFESLTRLGSIMGSGGMVVVDDRTCMVDFARFFLSFTQSESCGKCPPCRIGTYEMLQILNRIVAGKGEEGDIERLEAIGRMVKKTSLCGLGQSAPNPVLSTIKYFRAEYEAHIRQKYCPAGACTSLGNYVIGEDCVLCGLCQQSCPYGAVLEERDGFYIENTLCQKCGTCIAVCPTNCIRVEPGVKEEAV
ncbi:NADH-ubiquinone oxidoreductase-F iron-sulfur binding region domain-containing protein [Thermodesulfitimonas sp.]